MLSIFARIGLRFNTLMCSALLVGVVGESLATTVLSVGTEDLAARSGFIFHGKVVERWVVAGSKEGSIYTYLRFSVNDVLKGSAPSHTVVLRFLGGTLDGRTLRVEGMKMPTVGEEGVFFVENPARHQAYPFFGWDQGRFLVQTDAFGQKRVFTHDLKPVSDVNAAKAMTGISAGHAAGIDVAATDEGAMTLEAFMGRVRALVEEQQ